MLLSFRVFLFGFCVIKFQLDFHDGDSKTHPPSWVLNDCDDVGVSVPEEVAVLGCDNEPLIWDYAPVPLSSIDNNMELQGYEAAKLLGQLMNGHQLSIAACSSRGRKKLLTGKRARLRVSMARAAACLQTCAGLRHHRGKFPFSDRVSPDVSTGWRCPQHGRGCRPALRNRSGRLVARGI